MKAKNRFDDFAFPSSLQNIDWAINSLNTWEAKNSYLELIKKKARKFLAAGDENPDCEIIKNEINRLCELQNRIDNKLLIEREKYYPLGKKFKKQVIEIELCNYSSYEGQIEYLKKKRRLFDELSINLTEYNQNTIAAYLDKLISNRQTHLKTYYGDTYFDFDKRKIFNHVNSLEDDKTKLAYLNKILDQTRMITRYLDMLDAEKIFIDEIELTKKK